MFLFENQKRKFHALRKIKIIVNIDWEKLDDCCSSMWKTGDSVMFDYIKNTYVTGEEIIKISTFQRFSSDRSAYEISICNCLRRGILLLNTKYAP